MSEDSKSKEVDKDSPEELDELDLGYKLMSEDREREREALEWIEGLLE